MHFGISEGKGALKHGSRPWLGMDIFWNCPISTNPGLHFDLGFFIFCSKAYSWIIFSILFRASSHQIGDKTN